MMVIFYSRKMDETAEAVKRVIENVSHDLILEVYHSIDSLRNRIIRPVDDVVLALIRPSKPSDIERLAEMKGRLEMLDIIIMATGESSDVNPSIQALQPRFVFNVDDSPEIIGLILKKMMERKMANPSYWPLNGDLGRTFG